MLSGSKNNDGGLPRSLPLPTLLDEFKADLAECESIKEFVRAVVSFIGSIEDLDLRRLALAEFSATLLEGKGGTND